ncbi:MAG: ComF family protein [Pseudomonadota bacterium]
MSAAHKILDMVLPPRCVVSGKQVDRQGMIAPDVWSGLRFIGSPQCAKCGLPFDYEVEENTICAGCIENEPSFKSARSALVYDDGSRDLVLRFKHADQMHSVLAFLPWLRSAGANILKDADFLVPVPLHRWRLLKRRYNQAAVIAQALGRDIKMPSIPDALLRVRSTPSQGHLRAKERAQNVKKAFAVNERRTERMKGKTIVLIDDVYTTGATVNECTRALLDGGAEAVHVLTLARVVK